MNPSILSVATAHPCNPLTQETAYDVLCEFYGNKLTRRNNRIMRKLFLSENGVERRYVAADNYADICLETQDDQVRRFTDYGTTLGTDAVHSCLENARVSAADVDCLVVNTCTGYLCPGLSSYLIERCGFRKDIRYYDLVGMGCAGAIPSLELAYTHLKAFPGDRVLIVAVEICTATFYMDNDIGLLVSNSIFGDGAGAMLLGERRNGRGVQIIDFETLVLPEFREQLRYRTENSKLRNVLDRSVPEIGATSSKEVITRLLDRHGMDLSQISHWIIHPGGTKVLDRIRDHVGIPEDALAPSRKVLKSYGNLSSCSVVFVLKEILETSLPARGELGMMNAFGAGFKNHALLLEF